MGCYRTKLYRNSVSNISKKRNIFWLMIPIIKYRIILNHSVSTNDDGVWYILQDCNFESIQSSLFSLLEKYNCKSNQLYKNRPEWFNKYSLKIEQVQIKWY